MWTGSVIEDTIGHVKKSTNQDCCEHGKEITEMKVLDTMAIFQTINGVDDFNSISNYNDYMQYMRIK